MSALPGGSRRRLVHRLTGGARPSTTLGMPGLLGMLSAVEARQASSSFDFATSLAYARDGAPLRTSAGAEHTESRRFAGAMPGSHNPRLAGEWPTTPALADCIS